MHNLQSLSLVQENAAESFPVTSEELDLFTSANKFIESSFRTLNFSPFVEKVTKKSEINNKFGIFIAVNRASRMSKYCIYIII